MFWRTAIVASVAPLNPFRTTPTIRGRNYEYSSSTRYLDLDFGILFAACKHKKKRARNIKIPLVARAAYYVHAENEAQLYLLGPENLHCPQVSDTRINMPFTTRQK